MSYLLTLVYLMLFPSCINEKSGNVTEIYESKCSSFYENIFIFYSWLIDCKVLKTNLFSRANYFWQFSQKRNNQENKSLGKCLHLCFSIVKFCSPRKLIATKMSMK